MAKATSTVALACELPPVKSCQLVVPPDTIVLIAGKSEPVEAMTLAVLAEVPGVLIGPTGTALGICMTEPSTGEASLSQAEPVSRATTIGAPV